MSASVDRRYPQRDRRSRSKCNASTDSTDRETIQDMPPSQQKDLEVCIDWGTFKWAASFAVMKNGEYLVKPTPLTFDQNGRDMRTIATWIHTQTDNGIRLDFVHGFDLECQAKDDRILSAGVMAYFKLCLYDGEAVDPLREKVMNILESFGKTLDDLITEHLKAIVSDIGNAIEETTFRAIFNAYDTEFQDALKRMKVRITVPQMWTPDARRRMQQNAKAAGLSTVVLAYEPKCALSHIVSQMARSTDPAGRPIHNGDILLVVDLGSGTGDFALYRLQGELSETSQLETIGDATGELCGSYQVDLILYKTLKDRMEAEYKKQGFGSWVSMSAAALGVTEDDFQRRALDAIEGMKREFSVGDQAKHGLVLGTGYGALHIMLLAHEITSAFDEVIEVIISKIDDLLARNEIDSKEVALMSVTGGFSKSEIVYGKLKAKYGLPNGQTFVSRPAVQNTSDERPVAVGGLERYTEIKEQIIPSQYGYAFLQREYASKEYHTEAVVKGPAKWKQWVMPSPDNVNEPVVDDRILNVIPAGTLLEAGKRKMSAFFHEYFIPVDDPHFTVECVYLDEQFTDHEASRDHLAEIKKSGATPTDKNKRIFRQGVHPLAEVRIPIPAEDLQDFIEYDGDYRIQGKFMLEKLEGSEDMRIGMLFREWRPQEYREYYRMDVDDDEEGEEVFMVWDTLWDAAHSPFPQG